MAQTKQEKSVREQQKKLIDEYARLEKQLAPYKPKQKRLTDLAKVIRSFAANTEPSSPLTVDGNRYQVLLSACGMETHITSLQEVYEAMGHDKFIDAASM